MKLLPSSLQMMIQELSRLPGVGEKTALRYAVTLIRAGQKRIESLERALHSMQLEVKNCSTCFFWTELDHCSICEDTQRSDQKLCVVRDSPDVLALEKFKAHPWKYHVLQGLLSPLSGIGPQNIRLEALLRRLEAGQVQEIILALDATVEGDATSLFIRDQLKVKFPQLKVSRTAMGIPAGSSVEYLDPSTLENALNHRTLFE